MNKLKFKMGEIVKIKVDGRKAVILDVCEFDSTDTEEDKKQHHVDNCTAWNWQVRVAKPLPKINIDNQTAVAGFLGKAYNCTKDIPMYERIKFREYELSKIGEKE